MPEAVAAGVADAEPVGFALPVPPPGLAEALAEAPPLVSLSLPLSGSPLVRATAAPIAMAATTATAPMTAPLPRPPPLGRSSPGCGRECSA